MMRLTLLVLLTSYGSRHRSLDDEPYGLMVRLTEFRANEPFGPMEDVGR